MLVVLVCFIYLFRDCALPDPMLLSMLKLLIKAQNELDVKAAYPRMTDLSSAKLEELAA